jgi:flagellar biogenesis protein FliO
MDGSSTLELVGRLLLSLAVVLGLMVAAAAVLRRKALPGSTRRRPVPIEVLGRQVLSRGASVAVVRAGGRSLVLGVTDTSVRLLAEADADSLEGEAPGAPALRTGPPGPAGRTTSLPGWTGVVDRLRDMTVRRS